MNANGTFVEDKMRRFKGECTHFKLKKCTIYTHDGASAKFSTNPLAQTNTKRFTVCTYRLWCGVDALRIFYGGESPCDDSPYYL